MSTTRAKSVTSCNTLNVQELFCARARSVVSGCPESYTGVNARERYPRCQLVARSAAVRRWNGGVGAL
ncbi:MAG: hypothetical protein IT477_06990 [Rhodanobacteraceae bacterium]|nr:hypothetical protein [Rhodanobacteraceae bacterium]MDL1868364.1 hypothetical protein [Gammaproteobacteria bacterium PRO6]